MRTRVSVKRSENACRHDFTFGYYLVNARALQCEYNFERNVFKLSTYNIYTE
jgi:hypothetical protein